MEMNENVAGLGKNHNENAHEHDIAKKQSEAKPAAENLEMMPNSRNANGVQGFLANEESNEKINNIHQEAANYAKEEHEKADNWENRSTDKDIPTA